MMEDKTRMRKLKDLHDDYFSTFNIKEQDDIAGQFMGDADWLIERAEKLEELLNKELENAFQMEGQLYGFGDEVKTLLAFVSGWNGANRKEAKEADNDIIEDNSMIVQELIDDFIRKHNM